LSPPAPEPAAPHLGAVLEAYVGALLAPDTRPAWQVVADAVADGAPPRRIYLDVLAPAMQGDRPPLGDRRHQRGPGAPGPRR
jgi:hypothetical protein